MLPLALIAVDRSVSRVRYAHLARDSIRNAAARITGCIGRNSRASSDADLWTLSAHFPIRAIFHETGGIGSNPSILGTISATFAAIRLKKVPRWPEATSSSTL